MKGRNSGKAPLWQLLVEGGFCDDREAAVGWIMSGNVLVNGERVDKSGAPVAVTSEIRIRGIEKRYVGRGGLKLEGALRDFELDIQGWVALDAGASHGGFTDCLLKHGARRVYAVDVGYGQLAGSLRIDRRVVNLEKRNISDIEPEELDPRPRLATIDLSYLSLRKAVPIVSRLLLPEGIIICLVKPLFEVEDKAVRRKGLVPRLTAYVDVLNTLVGDFEQNGYTTLGVTHSPIRGAGGTIEFLLLVASGNVEVATELNARIEASVAAAHLHLMCPPVDNEP